MQSVADVGAEANARLLEDAVAYNRSLAQTGQNFFVSDEERKRYDSLLDIDGTGIMGYIEIDSIGCSLPIYHGTDDAVLQIAVGHIAGTSLPVGGEGTHCVLSGHRGLPSAKLFTDLDKLAEGDVFVIRTLDEVLTYEVDRSLIVYPSDVSALGIEEGADLCTLVTCTPYGVNSHRLLVQGHRIPNRKTATIRVSADALVIDRILAAPIFALPFLAAGLVWLIFDTDRKAKRTRVRKALGLDKRIGEEGENCWAHIYRKIKKE